MDEKTVEISVREYKEVLELAYKAAMLKEAVLNTATLDFLGQELYFGGVSEVATVFKYAFPSEYERKLCELRDKEKADGNRGGAGNGR